MNLNTGARLGPYEIVGRIGAGGMGEVYKAWDTRLDRAVAIKVLPFEFASDPDRRARFEREARAVAALNHPHICNLHDIGDAPNPEAAAPSAEPVRFLVMEYLEGQTLSDRLRRGALPPPTSGATPSSSPARSTTRTAAGSCIGISSRATSC
jgi:eukaryotic-like serine/threonine-protein kinase